MKIEASDVKNAKHFLKLKKVQLKVKIFLSENQKIWHIILKQTKKTIIKQSVFHEQCLERKWQKVWK